MAFEPIPRPRTPPTTLGDLHHLVTAMLETVERHRMSLIFTKYQFEVACMRYQNLIFASIHRLEYDLPPMANPDDKEFITWTIGMYTELNNTVTRLINGHWEPIEGMADFPLNPTGPLLERLDQLMEHGTLEDVDLYEPSGLLNKIQIYLYCRRDWDKHLREDIGDIYDYMKYFQAVAIDVFTTMKHGGICDFHRTQLRNEVNNSVEAINMLGTRWTPGPYSNRLWSWSEYGGDD